MRETLVKSEEFKDSPVGRIPKDWDVCPLKDLTDSRDSITYGVLKPGEYIPDGIPLLQIQDVIHGNIEPSKLHRISKELDAQYARTRLYGGEVVMSLVGTIGKIAQIPDSMAGANLHRNLARIPISRGNSSRFVFHYLQSQTVQKAIAATTFGSTQSLLNLTDLRELLVAVPPPQEQQTIASIIDTMDEAIAHTSSLIAKLKQMKAGLLHDLLTRGLDENGELRDAIAHPEQFKDSPLGRIPKDWDVRLVGEVFDLQLGKMLSKASKIGHSPFPYLANRNVQWDEVDLSDLEWMDFNDNEREKFSLLPGDLLVCEGGESGRTAIWKGEMENCYFQKALHRLRPKDSQVLPDYMLRFMRRAFEHGFLTSFTSQTSITHLTREKFALLPLPLPTVEEQKAIVNLLDSLDTRIRKEEAYRDKLKLQKQGLMHDLLTGKVRVKNA
jgi:type I restriction enzyme S subunit